MDNTLTKLTTKLLQCDEPSPYTGRIYPREEVEKAIADYQTKINAGAAFGTFNGDLDVSPGVLNIANVSHKVTGLSINEAGEVIAEIEFLDTPPGKLAMSLAIDSIEHPRSVRLSPSMIGHVNDNMEAYEISIFQTSWLPDIKPE